MRVLVTGGTGYAGRSAAIALRRAGHAVSALVRNPDHPVALSLRHAEVLPAVGDLAKPDTYREHIKNADVVVHTVLDHSDPVGTDDRFLEQLIDVAAQSPFEKKGLIYTTGCSIYGQCGVEIMDETTPGNPEHMLGFRMRQEEKVLGLDGIRKAIVRPGFMYGLDGKSSQSGVYFAVGSRTNSGERLNYYGDPKKRWSWVHIEDLADAYVRLAEKLVHFDGEIFCLADEQRPTVLEVFTRCVRQSGFEGAIDVEPASAAKDFFAKASDQDELITSAKARRLLDWVPRHSGLLDELARYHAAWSVTQEEYTPNPYNLRGVSHGAPSGAREAAPSHG